MTMNPVSPVPPTLILAEFCRRNHIRWLSVIGTSLGDDDQHNGEVDVLVEFHPGHTPGWEIVDLEEELADLFRTHRARMLNPKYLNHRLRDKILGSAVLRYAE